MKQIYHIIIAILFAQLYIVTEIKAIEQIVCANDTCASSRITNSGDSLIIVASNSIVSFNKTNNEVKPVKWYEAYNSSNMPTFSTVKDDDGKLWFADMYNLYCLNQEDYKKENYSFEDILFYGYSMQISSNGNIWIGGARSFYVFEPNNGMKKMLNPFDGANTISVMSNMEEDSAGNMWVAITSYGKNAGYNIIYYAKSYNYTIVCSKELDQVHTIQIDKNDNVWFASSEGISCMSKNGVREIYSYSENPEFGNDFYVASSKDEDNNIWFSSSTTLMKYDGEDFTTYTCPDYEEARSILCDDDIVWVLLKNDTLLKFQNNEFEVIDLSPAITGINESITDSTKAKAYVSNGVLNIENIEGIASVVVCDATGQAITSANANGATSTQIALPSTIKGVIMVKVNSEVIKVAI